MIKFIDLNSEKKERLVFSKPGDYLVFFYNLSGNFIFEITSSGVNLNIFGLFLGEGKGEYQVKTQQHHKMPASTSNLLIKGVFFNQSRFYFEGLIRVEKEGQKTYAYQKNQNLLLSSESFVESKPYLEILANDVFCTHGSTTSFLNQDELFYLSTRGLEYNKGKWLLVSGFVNEVFEKMRKLVDFSLFKKYFLEVENFVNQKT